jgi:hypothetical protein
MGRRADLGRGSWVKSREERSRSRKASAEVSVGRGGTVFMESLGEWCA